MHKLNQADYDNAKLKATYFASRHSLDKEDVQSYLLEKLCYLATKFDPSIQSSFIGMCNKYYVGYLLNYIRDVVYPKSIPRAWLASNMRFNKLLSLNWPREQAAIGACMPLEMLECIASKMQNARYANNELQAWHGKQTSKSSRLAKSKLSFASMQMLEALSKKQPAEICNSIAEMPIDLQSLFADNCSSIID